MKKKYISLLLMVLIISTIFLSACDEQKEAKENVKDNTRTAILKEFSSISEVPRDYRSKDMSSITNYITNRAKELGLESAVDSAGNVMIEKPATPGYENAPVTVLQTNFDMVAEASPSIIFDSKKDGITPIINETGNAITGNHTSLGASSGLGMATSLYVLENTVSHGGIKAVFTIDGEGDMSGAKNIDANFIQGDYLINLNNEKDKNIEMGSAFSAVLTCTEKISMTNTKNKYSFVIAADGFSGGDSGIAAQDNKGNPIMFIAEVLAQAKNQGLMFELNDFSSGDKASQIPKEATAVITVNEYEKSKIHSIFNKVKKNYQKDHLETDPDMILELIETTVPDKAIPTDDAGYLISFLYGIIDGKYNENEKTTASSNVGYVRISEDKIVCKIFAQTKLQVALDKIITDHQQMAKISNMTLSLSDQVSGYYTGKTAYLSEKLNEIYSSAASNSVELDYRTSRTELGFFHEKNSEMQMVSIGPTIVNEGRLTESVKLSTVDIPAMVIMSFLGQTNTN